MADDLLRSSMGDPSVPLSSRTPAPKTDRTSAVLSQLSALGAAGTQLYTKEHENNMQRQAKNDIVNNTINPDLRTHEASYAQVVAKGEALKGFTTFQQDVADGKYENMHPDDFQKLMTDTHRKNKEAMGKSKFRELEAEQYDNFWVQNESTLTSGQAGMYRKVTEVKQGRVLYEQLGELVKVPTVTADQIMEAALTPELTMLDEENRITAMLAAGVDLARINPQTGLDVLKDLNEELSFSTDPQRQVMYAAAVKKARKDISTAKNTRSRQEERIIIATVDTREEAGTLENEHWTQVAGLKDVQGKPIYTKSAFNAKVNRSKKIRAKNTVLKTSKADAKAGVNLNVKKSVFADTMNSIFLDFMAESGNDTVASTENIGRLLVDQSDTWDDMKDRATMFESELMLTGSKEVNKATMQRYQELAALERGMGFNSNGKKTFAKYMGKSLSQYKAIQEALTLTKDSEEGAWLTVAESLNLRKEEAKRREAVASLSIEGRTFGTEVADSIWQEKDNPWLPNAAEEAWVPDIGLDRVANVVAKAYDEHIKDGWGDAVSKTYAETQGHAQIYKWGGELYDTRGQEPALIFGTPDPEGAFNTMIRDPQWNAELKEMFGITFGEMFFGIDEPEVTEEDIREQRKERGGKELHLQVKNIIKDINLDTGMLEFRSPRGVGTVMSVPLLDIGRAHEARLQNTEEIERLDRLYGAVFQATEEGKQWAVDQEIANDKFLNNILGTDKAAGRTTTTTTEYADMTDIEKTRNRLQFHKDNYSGITGKLAQIADFFNLKRQVDNSVYTPIFMPDTVYHGKSAITAVEQVEGSLTESQKRVIELEGFVKGTYTDTKGITTSGVGQTGKYMNMSFKDSFRSHEQDLSRIIPSYSKQSKAVQQELIQAMYRGDIQESPKFVSLFNAGKYRSAAKEFLNNDEYRDPNTPASIKARMKSVAKAVRRIK